MVAKAAVSPRCATFRVMTRTLTSTSLPPCHANAAECAGWRRCGRVRQRRPSSQIEGNAMTKKADFNAEEWAAVAEAPVLAGMRLVAASRRGTIRDCWTSS